MKKEIECKVVEDLLFGYVDKTLNNESKKLVENHLKDCKDCKQKLNEILEENKQNEKIQQREIDYLKKIKTKSRIKSILVAIGIIILILLLLYLIKFIRISNIMCKAEKSLKSQNYYCEKQENSGENSVSVSKIYYKDGKYKITNEIYSDNGKELISTEYGEVESDERKIVNEREKIVTVYKGDISETFNKEENVKRCIANNHMGCVEFNNLIVNIPSLEAIRFSYIGLEEYYSKRKIKVGDRLKNE